MKDADPMPFGKHKGKKLGDVPAGYLLWCYDQPTMRQSFPEFYKYLEDSITALQQEYRGGKK